MKKEELIRYSSFNEEDLPFSEKLKLAKMTKKDPDVMTLILFNKQPNFLRDYEKIYFAKYLSKNCSFYEKGDDVYVAPSSAEKKDLNAFAIPDDVGERQSSDEYYSEMGIGYRNVRTYSMIPGAKYKLIKGRGLTGYPSQDRPWELISSKIDIKANNMLDLYRDSRKFLGPKKCKYAFQCYDQKVTWEEFEEMVNKYINSLSAAGVSAGDVVPICITGTIEATALYFACDSIGATTFFIDPNEANAETMHKYFNRFDSKIVFASCACIDKIKTAIVDTNISKAVIVSPTDSMNPKDNISEYSKKYIEKNTVEFSEDDIFKSFNTFINDGKNYTGKINYCTDNTHISLITSTSSSTGEPKLIELSRENIMFELETIKKTTNIFLGPNGVNMQVVPFKYPYGFIVSTLVSPYVGKTAGLTPDFSLQDYVKFFAMYRPKYLHTVPSHIKHMAKTNDPELIEYIRTLDFAVSGGDKFETSAKYECNKFFENCGSKARVKDASGMAEITAGITASTVGKYNIESVGKPMFGTTVKVVDENENELPYDHVGKLWYTGPNVMQRYNNDPERTEAIKYTDENGITWIKTDSYGFIDTDGFVYMCGRERDFFITYPAGSPPKKVYVDYIEKVINSCEEVFESVAVKKPDDEADYVPRAYVTLKPDVPEEKYEEVLEKIKLKCQASLDAGAIPQKIEIVKTLKTKTSMKVDKQYYMDLAQEEYENEKKVKEL